MQSRRNLTVEDLKRVANKCIPHPVPSYRGCFILKPPVQVVSKESVYAHLVFVVNENGSHPGCVQLSHGGIWWMANLFRFLQKGEAPINRPCSARAASSYRHKAPSK